jgi:hypothetical protein
MKRKSYWIIAVIFAAGFYLGRRSAPTVEQQIDSRALAAAMLRQIASQMEKSKP